MHSIASLSTGAEQVPLRGPRDYPLPAGQGTACQRHVRKAYIVLSLISSTTRGGMYVGAAVLVIVCISVEGV